MIKTAKRLYTKARSLHGEIYHLHDPEAQRRMNDLDFLGGAGGRSAGQTEGNRDKEDAEPPPTGSGDDGDSPD